MSTPSDAVETRVDPQELMQRVRARASRESLASDAGLLDQLELLQREILDARRRLNQVSGHAAMDAELDGERYARLADTLERARELQEIPPGKKIAQFPPFNFLFKVVRKFALRNQREYNRAVTELFSRSFESLLRLERMQLELLERLMELERRHKEAARRPEDQPPES